MSDKSTKKPKVKKLKLASQRLKALGAIAGGTRSNAMPTRWGCQDVSPHQTGPCGSGGGGGGGLVKTHGCGGMNQRTQVDTCHLSFG